jgi:two-component sensor histidine kinase
MHNPSDDVEAPSIDRPLDPEVQAEIRRDAELQRALVRSTLALEAGGMGSWQWDYLTGQVFGDARFCEIFGIDPSDDPESEAVAQVADVMALIHPDDVERVTLALDRALIRDEDYATEFRVCLDDRAPAWVAGRGRVVERDDDGKPVRVLGLNWDISEQKANEDSLQVFAAEMDHRLRNSFALIRAMVTLTERSAADKSALAGLMRQQIGALAEAHAVTAALANEQKRLDVIVPVGSLVEAALAPWLTGARRADNITIDLTLSPDASITSHQASALSMLLYELATNAVKYGPLSERGGALAVKAEVNEGHMRLVWDESLPRGVAQFSGDNDEALPSGFGSTLLQHCRSVLNAEVHRGLRPTGLFLELSMDVPSACD